MIKISKEQVDAARQHRIKNDKDKVDWVERTFQEAYETCVENAPNCVRMLKAEFRSFVIEFQGPEPVRYPVCTVHAMPSLGGIRIEGPANVPITYTIITETLLVDRLVQELARYPEVIT